MGPEEAEWVAVHWPHTGPGERVEVGRIRDAAWADVVSRVDSGLLVAVDYGHIRATRPRAGRSRPTVPAAS